MTGREMLQRLANRLSGVPQTIDFVAALNTTIQSLEDHLWASSSDWLRQDLVLDFAAGDTSLALPDDFLGFVERPYTANSSLGMRKVRLEPLPHNMDHQLAASGPVRYYDLRGTTMKLVPVPNAAGAVTARYYQRQPRLDTLDDDLPFSGFFDYVIQDAVVLIAQQGLLVCQTPPFVQMIANQVDRLIGRRAPKYVHFRGMK